MRRSQFSSFWSLILVCVVQAGCANTPAVSNLTNWIPGRAEKVNPQALDAQLSLARLSERHGDPGTAEKIYQAALKKDPQNQLAHHRLGVLAAKTGQLDRAAEYLDAAARLGPPSAALLNDIGYNLLMLERLPEAEAAFRHALEIDPQNKSAHNNLGLVLGQTGRYAESLAEFRQAGSEDEAQANLAYAKTRAGDLQGAQSAYHRALSLNQELKPAAEALIQLAQQAPPPGAAPVPSEANCERTPRMSESRRFGTGATDRHAGMNSNLAGRDQDANCSRRSNRGRLSLPGRNRRRRFRLRPRPRWRWGRKDNPRPCRRIPGTGRRRAVSCPPPSSALRKAVSPTSLPKSTVAKRIRPALPRRTKALGRRLKCRRPLARQPATPSGLPSTLGPTIRCRTQRTGKCIPPCTRRPV